jgi:hypothetical protein
MFDLPLHLVTPASLTSTALRLDDTAARRAAPPPPPLKVNSRGGMGDTDRAFECSRGGAARLTDAQFCMAIHEGRALRHAWSAMLPYPMFDGRRSTAEV